MTEPQQNLEQATTLARIEVKLDNALDAQKEHKSTLDRHSVELVDHGTRLTRLETRDQADSDNHQRTYTGKQLAATSTGAAAALAGVVAAILQAIGRA